MAAPVAAVPIGGGAAARKQIFRVFFIAAFVVAAAGAGVYWYLFKGRPAPAPPPSALNQHSPAHTNQAAPKTNAPPLKVAAPDPWHGLKAGPVTLEKARDGNLVYAVGKLRNESDHERFGVKVELDVFDAANEKIGTATDYTSSIVAGKEWRFKALVTDRGATKAKLIVVKED